MSTAKLLETPTRERTMEIAARRCAQNGFKGVAMRDIANAVGSKAASLYNHFSDKEDLYLSSLEHAFSFRFEDLRQALASTGSPEDRLVAVITALTRANAEDEITTKLLMREMLVGDRRHQKWLTDRLFKEPFHQMADLLEELGAAGEGQQSAIYLSALTMGHAMLTPFFEEMDLQESITDPDKLGRDIADKLTKNYTGNQE